jgi:hypothetical protein
LELFDKQKEAVGQGERTLLVYVELPTNRHIHNGRDEFLAGNILKITTGKSFELFTSSL